MIVQWKLMYHNSYGITAEASLVWTLKQLVFFKYDIIF